MFEPFSRYHGVPVAGHVDDTGRVQPWVTLRIPAVEGAGVGYRVRPHDRLDLLAARAYGDPGLWWYLADANPADVTDLPSGLVDEPGRLIALPHPVRPEVLP